VRLGRECPGDTNAAGLGQPPAYPLGRECGADGPGAGQYAARAGTTCKREEDTDAALVG
jgi:hypothetical protein